MADKKAVVAGKAPIPVEVEAGKAYFWCTCGLSKNQPFCDGAHPAPEVGGPRESHRLFLRLQADQRRPALRRDAQPALSGGRQPFRPRPKS